MDTFSQSLDKLSTLLASGHITQTEYDVRRKKLVDDFVGRPGATGVPAGKGGAGPMRRFGGGVRAAPAAPAPPARGAYTNLGGEGYGYFTPYYRPARRGDRTAVKIQPVPDGTTVDELKDTFSVFGQVVTAVIKEGTPRHGYVNFGTSQEAYAASAGGVTTLQGQVCQVTPHWRPRAAVPEGDPTNGIGIFNIPFSMTQDEVETMLQQYPGFQTLKYVTNKMGMFRGYVFAYFDTVDNASYAKVALLGMNIGDQVLDVKYSNRSAEEVFQDPAATI